MVDIPPAPGFGATSMVPVVATTFKREGVLTANKISVSGPLQDYKSLLNATSRDALSMFRFETTVGAGLPILETAQFLFETGDGLLELEGLVSGTLSYLMSLMEGGRDFSESIRFLKEQGYAEPDPLIDLSGVDVARKLVILARQFESPLCLPEVRVRPLLPDDLRAEHGAQWDGYDAHFRDLISRARENGEVLRYVARLTSCGTASVELRSFPEDHAFARLNPDDNIIQFKTRRYGKNPLIVRGPGAGRQVTAAGLYADILKVSQHVCGLGRRWLQELDRST